MNDENFDADLFMSGVTRQSLLYHWMLRSLGYDVEGQIKTLEAEVYGEELNDQYLSQRDIDELQLLLSLADGVKGRDNGFETKAIVFDLKYLKVRINKETNHSLPHFHIEYKREYRASYSIENLKWLVGEMPKKYEEKVLPWASRHRKSLKLTWDKIQAGEDVRGLVLYATENQSD
jgi:hypothetical protein